MIFTLTKTTCSQRGELFAKSDFHESTRLNAKVLYLRNSESCNLSRSVHLARRAMYTERSLRAATRFLQQISKKKKVPHISKQTFQFTRSPGLSLSAVSLFSLKEKQGTSN